MKHLYWCWREAKTNGDIIDVWIKKNEGVALCTLRKMPKTDLTIELEEADCEMCKVMAAAQLRGQAA